MRLPKRVFSKRLERDLWGHSGKWVAIEGQRIIAVGESAKEVYEIAQGKGVKVPLLYRVPGEHEPHFYGVTA